MSRGPAFWVVWRVDGGSPTVMHHSQTYAEAAQIKVFSLTDMERFQ